jgi:lipoate-protein ligase A
VHTLRFFSWDVPSLSIGSFQKISDLDMDEVRERGIPLARRPTGGRAVLHDAEITYSVTAPIPSDAFPSDLMGSYKKVGECFLCGLNGLGLDARLVPVDKERTRKSVYQHNPLCFSSPSWHEVLIGGKKLIGSAQRRLKSSFLQQGSIIIHRDIEGLASLLSARSSEALSTAIDLLDGKMTGLGEHMDYPAPDVLTRSLIEGFGEALGVEIIPDTPSERELELADRLLCEKYSTDRWNLYRFTSHLEKG